MSAMADPPTENQLKRIEELLEHPALDEFASTIIPADFQNRLRNKGTVGVLISWMKKKIEEYERTR